jgi:hypothetical protein
MACLLLVKDAPFSVKCKYSLRMATDESPVGRNRVSLAMTVSCISFFMIQLRIEKNDTADMKGPDCASM